MSKDDNAIYIDKYKPNYNGKCENCGQKPIVTGVLGKKVVYNSGMCGPCTFGAAETLDVKTWNN